MSAIPTGPSIGLNMPRRFKDRPGDDPHSGLALGEFPRLSWADSAVGGGVVGSDETDA